MVGVERHTHTPVVRSKPAAAATSEQRRRQLPRSQRRSGGAALGTHLRAVWGGQAPATARLQGPRQSTLRRERPSELAALRCRGTRGAGREARACEGAARRPLLKLSPCCGPLALLRNAPRSRGGVTERSASGGGSPGRSWCSRPHHDVCAEPSRLPAAQELLRCRRAPDACVQAAQGPCASACSMLRSCTGSRLQLHECELPQRRCLVRDALRANRRRTCPGLKSNTRPQPVERTAP